MTKMLMLTYLTTLVLTAAGYSKDILIPKGTIVAMYIDLEKAYDNGKTIASTLIEALPPRERTLAKEGYEDTLKKIDKFKDILEAEWAIYTFGGDLKRLTGSCHPKNNLAAAIKIHADANDVKKVLTDVFETSNYRTIKKDGHVVFEFANDARLGLIDKKYIILSASKDAFEDMFDLYAGKGKASDEIDNLSKISGNTICRISTAPISSLLERFELTRYVEKFGEACEDDDLADMILNMKSISLDIGMNEEMSLALHVECGSSDDAKTIETLMQGAALLARVGCDFSAFFAIYPDIADKFGFHMSRRDGDGFANAKDILIDLAHNFEARRRWRVSTLSCKLRIEKVANFIKNTYSKKANIKTARILISKVEYAAQRYNTKHNKYPDSLDVLKEPTVESGVPLLESDTIDPWGNEVRYEKRGGKPPRITSAGPDGEFDTDDDFMNLDAKLKKKGETSSSRRNIQKTTCIMNMKQLLTAAESWLAKYPDRVPTLTDLCGPEKYLKKELTCPKDGSHYRIIRLNNRTIDIRCGSGDPNHVLP